MKRWRQGTRRILLSTTTNMFERQIQDKNGRRDFGSNIISDDNAPQEVRIATTMSYLKLYQIVFWRTFHFPMLCYRGPSHCWRPVLPPIVGVIDFPRKHHQGRSFCQLRPHSISLRVLTTDYFFQVRSLHPVELPPPIVQGVWCRSIQVASSTVCCSVKGGMECYGDRRVCESFLCPCCLTCRASSHNYQWIMGLAILTTTFISASLSFLFTP